MSEINAYITNTTQRFFNVSTQKLDETSDGALIDFINNPRVSLLQACLTDESQIMFYTTIQVSAKKSIIFYKPFAMELTMRDGLNNMNMITLTTGAAESLYTIIRQIYSPMLAINDDLFSNKLQKTLLELESDLRLVTHGKGTKNIEVILCIEDEADYWKSLREKRDATKNEREAASAFCVLFEDICEEIKTLPAVSMQEVRDSVENIGGILDDVWRYTTMPYSQERMVHTFNIIGHVICSITQQAASKIDLWGVHYGLEANEVLHLLTEALTAVRVWVGTCKTLTETYWPNYALHEWKGKPYVPIFCQIFQKRLEEIHNIRATFNQLSKLLTKSERAELNCDQLLEPFQNINVWICNGPNQMWENAVSRFSSNIRPAEAKIAEKLKPRLQNMNTKQSLYDFCRYRALVGRPRVQQALSAELEMFLGALRNLLQSTEADVVLHRPPEMTDLVAKVQWARHMEDKVKEIETCVEKDLKNLDGSEEVLQFAAKVQRDLKTAYTQLYDDWSRDIQAQLRTGSLQLAERPVVEFSSSDRLMVVNFPAGLERVEREARALLAAGLPPPPATLAELSGVLQHARALHQVASFHNTLGARAVASTRPMLLRTARRLAALVAERRPPCWADEEALQDYTHRLEEKVLELEKQNNYLTGQHLKIRSVVEKLMETELLAKLSDWKTAIKDIRGIIEKVEANGYENTAMWRSHWDGQLYKAVECQYVKALLSLHTHFPILRVDLVLRGGRVRCQPSEEELRARLYGLLRRLVALPSTLTALSDSATSNATSLFEDIVDKHSWLGNRAVSQLERALGELQRACDRWTGRAALGCIRVKDLCAQLSTADDWELNFKACKAYGQTVAKISFEDEKIEWITVGTVSLRREMEAQARSLWASLMSSLTASCREQAVVVDTFMASASLVLDDSTIPKNAKELAEIIAKQQALQEKLPEMEKIVGELKRKSQLVRTWGGDGALEEVARGWSELVDRVAARRSGLSQQAEIVKSSLAGECSELASSVESWSCRWSRVELHDTTYAGLVAAWRDVSLAVHSWAALEDRWTGLVAECKKFNMDQNMPEIWQEAEKIKTDLTNLWTPFEKYHEEYEALAAQKWVMFQKKLHQLDEFVSKWEEGLEPYTPVTVGIKRELEKYSDLTSSLRYLRGSDLTEKHWREVFGLLGTSEVSVDDLTVGTLLGAAAELRTQIKALQKIHASASSEAAVRRMLSELELWFEGARLTLDYHVDANRGRTPLGTNYEELILQVEEHQWAVSGVGRGSSGALWEDALGSARTLLRAASRAQRRYKRTISTDFN